MKWKAMWLGSNVLNRLTLHFMLHSPTRLTSGLLKLMRKHSVTYKQWDIVVVPFPFSNRSEAKRRPALVLSNRTFNSQGHTILAMVTTSGHYPWAGDVNLADYKAAGLNTAC